MSKCIHCGKETVGLICDNENCIQKGKMFVSPFMLTNNEYDLMISLCSRDDETRKSEKAPIHRYAFMLQLNEIIDSADDIVAAERKGIRKRAVNGDIDAQRNLGISLLKEKMPEAYIWLKKAGLKGDVIALIGMARCYMCGFGINEDGDNIKQSESLGHLIEYLTHSYLCAEVDYETIIEIIEPCITCQDAIVQLENLAPLTDEAVKMLKGLINHIRND